ncbi:fatty acid CoA ligase family protein [Shewanella sp. GXUN23E]|uniref:fatty acid CoA ligase family protein n=1 Tax=Shewanella sp. GXUN23E TaxID=3422498 RepID=UPI003D7E4F06
MMPVESEHSLNLCRHLQQAALARPTDLAVARQHRDGRFEELTLAQLDKLSDRIALALEMHGIVAGMKAVLMVTPGPEFFALTFALFKAGIIPVMADPGMGTANLKACLDKAAPDAFIGIPRAQLARRLLGWGKATIRRSVTVNGAGLWGGRALDQLLKRIPDDGHYCARVQPADALCAILFTSGSTGEPKGVCYSHGMFEAQIRVLREDYGITPGEADLATFPLFALFGPALGMTSVIPDMDASRPIKADPGKLLNAVERYQCSNLFLNPALLAKFAAYSQSPEQLVRVRRQLCSVRRVISAGAPADVNQIARFCRLLPPGVQVFNSYGATEALPVSRLGSDELLTTAAQTDAGAGICVGNAVGVDIRIAPITQGQVQQASQLRDAAPGEIGEILVRGPVVSPAYYDNPAATARAKVADGKGFWHRMGDVGYLDDAGRLWMCGRLGHRVEGAGKVWFTLPCERILNTHPGVRRTALVGVDSGAGVQPVICVELQPGADRPAVFRELATLAESHEQTRGLTHFIVHPGFPMDVRHNAKIFREKLALWTQKRGKWVWRS